MTLERAEGRLERHVESAAANEDFTQVATRQQAAAQQRGWDPFEVWRTRVKRTAAKSTRAVKDRAHDAQR